eukprot:12642562-Alexandrium_andersonii.AAC.1
MQLLTWHAVAQMCASSGSAAVVPRRRGKIAFGPVHAWLSLKYVAPKRKRMQKASHAGSAAEHAQVASNLVDDPDADAIFNYDVAEAEDA